MAKLYSWEFRTSPSCHQNMFGSKNMFSKILLLLMTFIHILSKSFSLSNYISVNNAEYPVVMPSSSVNHYKRTGVQERECFSGRLCEYRISESDFLCKVQIYVLSKKAERFLPEWLWFNEEKRILFGIPSEKDQGICDILIIGLTKLPNHPAGHICGSVTIKITVWGLNSFPLFAQNSLLRVKIRGNSDGQINTCAFNEPIILASLVLSSNILDLNGEKRWEFIEALSSSYDISIQNTFVLPNTVQNPFLNLLESSHVVASGPGANRFASGSSILLTWHVKCGVIQLDDPLFEQLKQLSQKWSQTKNISYGVIGWHVITGFQNHYVKHAVLRRRRNVIGGSTTLVHSTIPISRVTIVTTKLKPNKTTYRSQTVTLTRSLPSPTFSSPVGSSSLFDVFSSSSTVQLDQINSSSSQYFIRNSSSDVLRSRNLSMISQFLSSVKLRTSIQPSSTSTQMMQRSTTYILLPSSIHLISPSGYGTASNELLSSTEFTAKMSTISSFLIPRDTNNATSFRMRSSSNISPLIVNSSFLKTTPYPFLISSNSSFKILNTAIVSTLALIRSTELLSFTKKYLSSLKSNFVRTSALQQSRTYFTASQDFVLRTTSAISGYAADTTIVLKTINQSRSESSSSTVRPTQPQSIVSTHVLLASTQSYDRTASNPIYTVDFSSTTPMVNKTSQVVRSLLFRSSVIHQTKTVVSFQPYSSTPGVNNTSKASRTILTSTINKQRETATRQLVTYSSKLNLYSSTDDTAIKKGSTVTSTQSMSTGFYLQTSVKDETTFSKTLIQTSRKTSQFQTTVLTSSKYMVSDFVKTTTATRFKPVQSSATSVTLTKEISSLLTSMKDKTTFSKTLVQTSSKTSQFKISGTTTATSFKPIQLSSTSVIRNKGISSSVSRAITDTMSTTNFTETTFVSSMPTSVVKLTSLGLTTLFVSSKIVPSTIELSAATAERSRSSLNSTTLRILPTSSTPLLSPSLLTNYFNTAALTLPTEQLTSTPSFSYFIKEPSSTPLVTPTSVQTNTGMINQASVTFNKFASFTVIHNQTFGHSSTTSEVFETSLMSMVHTNLILSLPSTSLSSLNKQMISSTIAITHNFTSTIPFSTPTSFGSLIVSSISSSKVSSSLFSLSYRSSCTVSSLSLQSFLSVASTLRSGLSSFLLLPSTHQTSYYKNSMTASFSVSSSVETDVIQSPLLSVSSSSTQRVIVRSLSSPPPSPFQSMVVSSSLSPSSSNLFQSLVLSGSSSSSLPPRSLQSVIVSGSSLLSPPSSSLQSVVVSSPSPSPPSSSLQSPVVLSPSPSPPSSSLQSLVVLSPSLSLSSSYLQSVVVSSLSPSPSSSSFQSVVVSSPSPSLPSSSLQSVIVSSPSPSPPSSSFQSVIVSSPSPSPPSSSLQSLVVLSPSPSLSSSYLQSVVVSSLSPSPSSSSFQSVVVSSPSPSLPSSSLQSVIVSSPSPSPPSSSFQSVIVSSPSPSPPSSSLQSVIVSSPSPSPPSSSLQSVVVSSPSPSHPSSSLQSVVVLSPSPSPLSSSLQSVVVSSPSPSLPSSSLQSPVVLRSSPSHPSSSLQSVVVLSPSPSPPSSYLQSSPSPSPSSSSLQSVVVSGPSPSSPSSSLQSVIVSGRSPSPSSSSLQSVVVSGPSPSPSSLQSVVVSSPSPSPSSSSLQSVVISSPSPSPSSSSLQSVVVSGPSPSPSSRSLQSVAVPGPSPSPSSSSLQSVVVSGRSPSPSSSSLQSVVVSGPSPSPSSLQPVVVSSPSPSPSSSSLQSVVISSPSPSLSSSSLQYVVVSSPSPSPSSSSLQSVVVSGPSPSHPSSSLQSVVVSSPSPSPSSSSLQSVVISSPSPSPSSSSLQSVVLSSPSPSHPSSSLQSVVVSSPSPSPSSSSLQSVVVSSPSPSPSSSSLQSVVISSPSPSLSSSSLQYVVVSGHSPSPPSSYLQSVVVSSPSPSPSSNSLQSVVVSGPSPSPPSSSLQSVIVSGPSPSPSSSSLQSVVVSGPSPSPSSSSLQSVVVSGPSPSPSPSSSLSPSRPSSSLQFVVISSPSPLHPSSSLQFVVVSSPSHSSSSFRSLIVSSASVSSLPPSSSVQSVVISSSSSQFTLLSSLRSSTVQSMSPSTLRSSDQSLLDRRSLSPTTSRFFHSFVKQSSSAFTPSQSSTFYSLTLSPHVKQTSRDSSAAHLSMSYKLSSMYFISPSIVTTHLPSISLYLLTSTKPAVTSSVFSFSSVLSTISPRYSFFSTTVLDTTTITDIKSQTSISEPDISLCSSSASPSLSSIVPFPTTPPKNSPKLYNSFDLLAVTVGKVFNVQIPIDTFHDREDGNTRNLFLSCLDGNHRSLSRSSWLQFNTTTQTLYGVVLASQVQEIKTSSEYLLVAKDRDGNKAYDAFTIDVRNNEKPLAVSFSVRIMGTNVEMFNQDLSNMLLLVQKIADYYGDKDESLIRVMSVEDGSVVVTWGNATVQTCNEDLINELTSRIVTTEGNIQPGFYNTLLPTFLAEDVYRNRTGPCISPVTTEDPSVARISSHDDSTWLKYFLLGLVVALLIIIVAVTCFIVRRHSGVKILKADKRTFKRRKPIIFDDELEMSTLSGKPIELPDDSLTPIRYPKETALTNPVYDGSDDEDFPEWSSPILPAPSYQRFPPRYGSSYNTPPPPYKLPPSY